MIQSLLHANWARAWSAPAPGEQPAALRDLAGPARANHRHFAHGRLDVAPHRDLLPPGLHHHHVHAPWLS